MRVPVIFQRVLSLSLMFGLVSTAIGETTNNRIFNRWKPAIALNIENGLAVSPIKDGWHSAQWTVIELANGFVHFQNRWKKNLYLNIEDGLQVSEIKSGWHSAQWKLVSQDGYMLIQNRWKPDLYLNFEEGLQVSRIEKGWHSAQWKFAQVGAGGQAEPVVGVGDSSAPVEVAAANLDAPAGGLGAAQIAEILADHNRERAKVGTPPLTWSAEVAAYAEEWARHLEGQACKLQHRGALGRNQKGYGENLAGLIKSHYPPGGVPERWASEKENYRGQKIGDPSDGVIGHYTAMVWRSTSELGCGVAWCGDKGVMVCNYNPAGNMRGQKPY